MIITAVMTLYHPDLKTLESNINVLSQMNISTIVYDNTPGDECRINKKWAEDADTILNLKISYKGTGSNDGLGNAYNACIKDCMDNDTEAFLILDQDTDLAKSSLTTLISSYHLAKKLTNLGVIGGKPVRADGASYRYKPYSSGQKFDKYFDALLVISSFSIIPKSAFEKTGFFQGDFFIDHIDYDFCWQCHKHGLKTLIDEGSTFTHIVGKGDVRLLGKIICPISEPFRGYYQVRNTLLSSSRGGAPILWTIKEVFKRFVVVSLNGLYDGNIYARMKFAIIGLIHGFKGISGKYT